MDFLQKIGQLFCEIAWEAPGADIDGLFSNIEPGGVMFRIEPGKEIQNKARHLQDRSRIPLLIASNLERGGSGGNGGLKDGTYFGSPMQAAATDDEEQAYRLGTIAGREGSAVGINWTFEPIIDIDKNFNNPIANVRTYGSDPKRVARMELTCAARMRTGWQSASSISPGTVSISATSICWPASIPSPPRNGTGAMVSYTGSS
jgi:beta-N-acetylhexosaminidase